MQLRCCLCSCILSAEVLSELLKVARWEIEIDLYADAFLLGQTDLFGQGLPLRLCPAVVFELHVEIKRNVRSVGPGALLKRTLVHLLDHVAGPADFFLGLLSEESSPLFFSFLKVMHLLLK